MFPFVLWLSTYGCVLLHICVIFILFHVNVCALESSEAEEDEENEERRSSNDQITSDDDDDDDDDVDYGDDNMNGELLYTNNYYDFLVRPFLFKFKQFLEQLSSELRTDDTRRSVTFTRLLISDAFRCTHNLIRESSE